MAMISGWLSLVVAISAGEISGNPALITDCVSRYYSGIVVTESGSVLFVDTAGILCTVSLEEPFETTPLPMDWDPAEHGWVGGPGLGRLIGSRDGKLICFTEQVILPDSLQPTDGFIPGPLLLVVSDADGSGARLLGLSFDVGGGPCFDFTMDGRFLYGNPLLECGSSPEDYISYWSGESDRDGMDGFMIDIADGSRCGGDGAFLGDGFLSNPMSDLAAAGWYPPNTIVDITGQTVLLEDTNPNNPAIIDRWVLPDAGLAMAGGIQVLRYADGREVENTGPTLTVYGILSDGRYVCSRDDVTSVIVCNMDWDDFDMEDVLHLEGLEDVIDRLGQVFEIPGGSGLLIRSSTEIYLYRL